MPTPDNMPYCVGPVGVGMQYDFCSSSGDCSAAFECVGTGFSTYCMQWCTSDADCGPFDLCYALNTPVYANGIEYGVCYDGLP